MRDGGNIIVTSSLAGTKVLPNHTVYAGTKAALAAFARNWAIEFKSRRIRVNTVVPGNVASRPEPFSTLNFGRNQVIANHAIVGLGQFGAMNLYNHLGSTELVADVMGYYAPF